MSARLILVLALVAYASIEANSYPYAAKGGQWQQQPSNQPFYEPAQVQAVAQQPLVQEAAPLKTPYVQAAPAQQPFVQEAAPLKTPYVQPARQEVFVAQQPQPVVSAPLQPETFAVKGQSFQPEQRFVSASKTPYVQAAPVQQPFVQQPYVHEAAPVKTSYVQPVRQETFVAQQPQPVVSAPLQPETVAVKGQSFQPEQRFEAASKTPYFQAAPAQQQRFVRESAPLKTPYVQPVRQEAFVAQQPQPVFSAPLQLETAVKGQSFQQEQRFMSASKTPYVQAVSAQQPLVQESTFKAQARRH